VSSSADKENGAIGPVTPVRRGIEPIFPPELRSRPAAELYVPGPVAAWHRPLTLDRLLELKKAHPEAKLVVGNSEVGIEMKFKAMRYPVLIGVTHVPELTAIEASDAGVRIGASVTLTKLLTTCHQLVGSLPRHQTATFAAVAEQLRWFAGPPIRYAAQLQPYSPNLCIFYIYLRPTGLKMFMQMRLIFFLSNTTAGMVRHWAAMSALPPPSPI